MKQSARSNPNQPQMTTYEAGETLDHYRIEADRRP